MLREPLVLDPPVEKLLDVPEPMVPGASRPLRHHRIQVGSDTFGGKIRQSASLQDLDGITEVPTHIPGVTRFPMSVCPKEILDMLLDTTTEVKSLGVEDAMRDQLVYLSLAKTGHEVHQCGVQPRAQQSDLMQSLDHTLWVSKSSVGHLGNFYWLAGANGNGVSNPLNSDVHLFIVGDKHRINFPTPNSEDVIRYILHRVRALS